MVAPGLFGHHLPGYLDVNERALREWGGRPPRTPAGSAATRLEARLGTRANRMRPWRLVGPS